MSLSREGAEQLFDDSKNQRLFSSFGDNATQVVHWRCLRGHEWSQKFRELLNSNGCQVCSGRKILPGYNDLATVHPNIAAEFHPTLNGHKLQSDYTFGSTSKAWWLCSKDSRHVWESTVAHRIAGRGCSVCSGKKVIPGVNDFLTTHPHLVEEVSTTKNDTKELTSISSHSTKKIWWECSQGHEWKATVDGRTSANPRNCPYCAGKQAIAGLTDVASNPELMAFWDIEKNEFDPTTIMSGSTMTVWWKDDKGHSWQRPVVKQKANPYCPYCDGRKVLPGFNDLNVTHPLLAAEWHPDKNDELLPDFHSRGSEKKIWWQADCSHEWISAINNRVAGNGCPKCWSSTFVSKAENELYYFLTGLGLSVEQSNRSILKGKELDLFIVDKNFAIEFNGIYYHNEHWKSRDAHLEKYEAAKTAGIILVQIWEDDWRDRKPVILRALAHKLGKTSELAKLYPELETVSAQIYARKTRVVEVTTAEARIFLSSNHVQGFAAGSHYLGLEDSNGVLRALMVLRKERDNTLNIIRYATAGSVTGGFTKLLKHAERVYQPSAFITFADHTISDGGLYENNGFIADKELPPDYMYVVKGERKHKFGYRLKKFRDDPTLLWDENLSERELALLNNIPRIWDAGKTRYRKICSS